MPSTAILGESLLYECARVLSGSTPISYYQYKAIESLVEILAFHDHGVLLVGEEADANYLEHFDWIITTIHERTDFTIDIVLEKHRTQLIKPKVIALFDDICRTLYRHSLGVTSEDLFSKQPKDRTSEDIAEYVEQVFVRDYPEFAASKFGEHIYEFWLKNANSSELLYFLRAHLIQALAEENGFTPIYENQRLIAAIFQSVGRPSSRTGTLPYAIYEMANTLFINTCTELLTGSTIGYPRISIVMHAVLETALSRSDLLAATFQLRKQLRDFRVAYARAEDVLVDLNQSLAEKSKVQFILQGSVNSVWVPLISSFGQGYTRSKIKKLAKGVFGKYGVGEVKLELSEKEASSESSTTFSTSLVGLAAAIAQTLSDIRKDAKLTTPNQPLVDVLLRAVKMSGARHKQTELLPVRDFHYKTPLLIDSLMVKQ